MAVYGFYQSQMPRAPLAHFGNELWPFMPLPSSWNVLRLPCSSVCSLPEEATLLWGERGAWSVEMKFCLPPASSWLIQSEPHAWGLEGITDMDFFRGLGCICPARPGKRIYEVNIWGTTEVPVKEIKEMLTVLLSHKHYLCYCCWSEKTSRLGKACVRSGLRETC